MKSLLSLFLFFVGFALFGQNCHYLYPIQQPLDPVVCGQYQLTFGLNGPGDDGDYELRFPGFDTIVFDLNNIPVIGPLSESQMYQLSVLRLEPTPCEENYTLGRGPIQDYFGGWNVGNFDIPSDAFCGLPTGEIDLWNDIPTHPGYNLVWTDLPNDTIDGDLYQLYRDSLPAGTYLVQVISKDGSDPCIHEYEFEVEEFVQGDIRLSNGCEDDSVEPAILHATLSQLPDLPANYFEWYDLETGELLQSSPDSKLAVSDEEGYELVIKNDEVPGCEFRDTIFPDTLVPLDTYVLYEYDQCFTNPSLEIIYEPLIAFSSVWKTPDGIELGPFIPSQSALESFGPGNWSVTHRGYMNGCVFYDTVAIGSPGLDCQVVTGNIFLDDGDCSFVSGSSDISIPNATITITDIFDAAQTFTTLADAEGFFELYLPVGNYQFSSSLNEELYAFCGEDTYLIADGINDIPLGYAAQADCDRLEPSVSAPLLRRCFVNTVYVEVCNHGSISAEPGTYEVLLDPFLSFVSGESTPISIDGDLLVFTHDAIAPFDCYRTSFSVDVSCDAALGQTHCISVATSANNCPETENYDGAFLQTNFTCTDTGFVATIYNTGNADMPDLLQYVIIEDGVMLLIPDDYQTSPPLEQGDSLVLPMPQQGPSYTLQVVQVNGAPGPDVLVEFMEGCAPGFSTGFANQLEQPTNYWESSICRANIGSYDPNDKAATPVGLGEEHYIQPRQELDYRIRFQNTGTDTAFTVVVRDTLSRLLDWTSLELGAASHRYAATIDTTGLLTFTFDNIMLPDSFVNEPASNGFVRFKIKVKDDIPLPSTLLNWAGIYFDFNEPVITNTVMHTIDTGFLVLGLPQFAQTDELYQLQLSPNPSSGTGLLVNLSGFPQLPQAGFLQLIDLFGRRLFQTAITNQQQRLDLPHLPSGTYIMLATDQSGRLVARTPLILEASQ